MTVACGFKARAGIGGSSYSRTQETGRKGRRTTLSFASDGIKLRLSDSRVASGRDVFGRRLVNRATNANHGGQYGR